MPHAYLGPFFVGLVRWIRTSLLLRIMLMCKVAKQMFAFTKIIDQHDIHTSIILRMSPGRSGASWLLNKMMVVCWF